MPFKAVTNHSMAKERQPLIHHHHHHTSSLKCRQLYLKAFSCIYKEIVIINNTMIMNLSLVRSRCPKNQRQV